jgi:hypothetical protein
MTKKMTSSVGEEVKEYVNPNGMVKLRFTGLGAAFQFISNGGNFTGSITKGNKVTINQERRFKNANLGPVIQAVRETYSQAIKEAAPTLVKKVPGAQEAIRMAQSVADQSRLRLNGLYPTSSPRSSTFQAPEGGVVPVRDVMVGESKTKPLPPAATEKKSIKEKVTSTLKKTAAKVASIATKPVTAIKSVTLKAASLAAHPVTTLKSVIATKPVTALKSVASKAVSLAAHPVTTLKSVIATKPVTAIKSFATKVASIATKPVTGIKSFTAKVASIATKPVTAIKAIAPSIKGPKIKAVRTH